MTAKGENLNRIRQKIENSLKNCRQKNYLKIADKQIKIREKEEKIFLRKFSNNNFQNFCISKWISRKSYEQLAYRCNECYKTFKQRP